MVVGILSLELYIPGALSLKEKRYVVKSIKTKIANKFNVSVSEVDHNDKWQRATLGIAKVSKDIITIDRVFNSLSDFLEKDVRIEIINRDIRIV